jgi:hypothetical protein
MVKSAKLAVVSVLIVVFTFFVKKLRFKHYRVFFCVAIALVNYNTIHEKIMREISPQIMTHSMEIITVFSMYFGMYAPLSWKYTFGILTTGHSYYFVYIFICYGSQKISLPAIIQHTLILCLVGRALYLKEQKDIENVRICRDIDKM